MAIISHKVEGVANDVTHYARVYPVNKKGHAQSELDGQIASALTNAFPAEPSSYNLIDTYTAATTFIAPEDGWYQIEVFGASGNGGSGISEKLYYEDGAYNRYGATGGGGGGSGYASSVVKLNKGDLVLIVIGATGSETTVTINPTTDEVYEVMRVTSGANGGNGSVVAYGDDHRYTAGIAGSGGVATGGNIENINGNSGSAGWAGVLNGVRAGGSGGSPAHTDGNTGGTGGSANSAWATSSGTVKVGTSGSAGFIKISRGDTNVVAA